MRMRRGVAVGCDLKVDWRRLDLGFARAFAPLANLDLQPLYKHRRIVNMSATLGRLKDVQTDLLYAYVAGWLYRG